MPAKQLKKRKRTKRKFTNFKQRLNKGFGVLVIITLLLIILSMIASQFFDVPFIRIPRQMIIQLVTPVQKQFSKATDVVADYMRKLKRRGNLEYEYEELLKKVDELTDQAMLVESLKQQLENYVDLGDEIERNRKLDGVKADVIGRETGGYTLTLTINVGKKQGVRDNMAVVVPGALVGYTYDVQANRSLVKCIIDTDCSISGLIESSRDQGTVSGTLALNGKNECHMYYLSYTTLPRPGDRVVTSGVGMEFPKGIPIGYVRESTRGLDRNKQYVVIDPIADFEHIEYVIVYRYRPSYAEKASDRGSDVLATFAPLATIKPVPTFIGQKSAFTPLPEETDETPTPSPSPTPTMKETYTNQPPSYVYKDSPDKSQATSALPDVSAAPTPEPSPTFSIDQVTVEEDE